MEPAFFILERDRDERMLRIAPPIDGIGVTGARDGLLTGGQFGPEGALTLTTALVVTLGAILWQSLREVRASVARGGETSEPSREGAASDAC